MVSKFYLTQSLRRAVQQHPLSCSTIMYDRKRTWSETGDRVARLASGLQSLGLARGGRVAILAQNSDYYFELMYAVPWAGGAVVPINTRLAAPEIDYILEDSGAEILVIDEMFVPMLTQLHAATRLKAVIGLDEASANCGVDFEKLIVVAEPIKAVDSGGDDLAGIFYTGGTSGKSKGVMLTHTNLVVNAMNCIIGLGIDSTTVYLHCGPMFHLGDGVATFGVTQMGGVHTFIPKFDPLEVLKSVERDAVTNFVLVPTMLNLVVNHPRVDDFDLSSVHRMVYGGSPIPEALLTRARQVWPDLDMIHGYGLTENSPSATMLPPQYTTFEEPNASKRKSCGLATPATDLRIFDENGSEVPRGQVGEVVVRGPTVMLGYWNKPEETATALRGGWLHTGDAGYMDDEGFVYIVDRVKDMIISGGENIYPAEVESAISLLPGVMECAVIGVPDEDWGECVHAIIVLKPGAKMTADDVTSHCRQLVAGYKCPRSFDFRTKPLPVSGAGKIQKHELRKPFWEG